MYGAYFSSFLPTPPHPPFTRSIITFTYLLSIYFFFSPSLVPNAIPTYILLALLLWTAPRAACSCEVDTSVLICSKVFITPLQRYAHYLYDDRMDEYLNTGWGPGGGGVGVSRVHGEWGGIVPCTRPTVQN